MLRRQMSTHPDRKATRGVKFAGGFVFEYRPLPVSPRCDIKIRRTDGLDNHDKTNKH